MALWGGAPGDGFTSLFNGRDLSGWSGDQRLWSVSGGILVGTTDSQSIDHNTFLIHEHSFSDFILRFDVRLRNGNSGVQFRSAAQSGPGWIVKGYQADLSEDGAKSAWGNFYEERGRGRSIMRTPDEGWRNASAVYRRGGWNHFEVVAKGSRMRISVNGTQTVEVVDDASRSGCIALQLHAGKPIRVEYRALQIKSLSPDHP